MSQVPDSLEAVDLWQDGSGLTSAMMEGQPKAEDQPKALEDGVESPPEFDRVADVLGPLEQVVLAADEQLGSIQQRVSSEAGEMSAQAEKRIREASDEQRRVWVNFGPGAAELPTGWVAELRTDGTAAGGAPLAADGAAILRPR